MTLYETSDTVTRYDLTGEVVARAKRTPDGWVITGPGGGQSEPIPDAAEARQRLAAWDQGEAAVEALRRALEAYRQARQQLEDAIRQAYEAGVPQTQIAQVSGFSRQWIRHLLQR
jgi:hypothetical protein